MRLNPRDPPIDSALQGYGVSPYAPAKIDLGGLLLGAIIGVGSILIIPKLLYVLSGNYGTYARSKYNIVRYLARQYRFEPELTRLGENQNRAISTC